MQLANFNLLVFYSLKNRTKIKTKLNPSMLIWEQILGTLSNFKPGLEATKQGNTLKFWKVNKLVQISILLLLSTKRLLKLINMSTLQRRERVTHTLLELFTKGSGREAIGMASVSSSGLMAPAMSASGERIRLVGLASSLTWMAINTKVNGIVTRPTASVSTFTSLEPSTRDSGKMIYSTGWE